MHKLELEIASYDCGHPLSFISHRLLIIPGLSYLV